MHQFMKKRNRCIELLEELNKKLKTLDDTLSPMPHNRLTHAPEQNVWSPYQICKHLQLSESLSLKNAKYNVGRFDTRPALNLKNSISSKGLSFVLFSPLKFKSPPSTRYDENQHALTNEEVFKDWWITREEMKELIKNCPTEAFSKQIYKHPYVGYLSLEQMLIFFRNHFMHHKKQIIQRLTSWKDSN